MPTLFSIINSSFPYINYPHISWGHLLYVNEPFHATNHFDFKDCELFTLSEPKTTLFSQLQIPLQQERVCQAQEQIPFGRLLENQHNWLPCPTLSQAQAVLRSAFAQAGRHETRSGAFRDRNSRYCCCALHAHGHPEVQQVPQLHSQVLDAAHRPSKLVSVRSPPQNKQRHRKVSISPLISLLITSITLVSL